MNTDYTFQGWLGKDAKSVEGNMVWEEFQPKPFTETDVDIKITHCGVCGTDIHTLRSGWSPSDYPCCVGHEIVGTAIRVGRAVSNIKVGDRVGVGAQCSSCLKSDCEECSAGLEHHCPRFVATYNAHHTDRSRTYGGYADYWRGPGAFVVKIPDGLTSAEAAPLLCAGITVFSPLKNNGAGPGKRIGIIGVGGLGHLGILFSKALRCDRVVAISRTGIKKHDAQAMGADRYIATDEEKDWAKSHSRTLDLIVSTVSSPKMPLGSYLKLLRTNGQFIQVGAPEDVLPSFSAFSLIAKGTKIGGSQIGSPKDIAYMLDFAAKEDVRPWVQERSLKEANQAIVDMEEGRARYRYVLVNEANAKL
ncbi:GroES-like protein [Patellaria atrata CBS 101060]|uniref:alcohol dehydrogenase (NADP(+)) n=1 Tax=Patellaria atrata CBS 101060 TaxID=1346257 RepID=A0A9P4VP89_9PEZI|nr:GroES-like protein [Patellaria atrata CBS 101060]